MKNAIGYYTLATFVIISPVMAQDRYYKESSTVVGYACPTGTYYRTDAKLCYPVPMEVPQDAKMSYPKEDYEPVRTKRLNSDTVTVNIYNGTRGQIEMPAMNIEGQVGAKRRRSLDKQAVIGAVAKAMDGEWIEEEKSEAIGDELTVE